MEGEPLMSRRILLSIGFIAAVAAGVSGQSGTAEGVAALARGDYQRAVEILKPIAEDWRSDDTAAQFFLAGLYETGRGVPADPWRACALYARAGSQFPRWAPVRSLERGFERQGLRTVAAEQVGLGT